MLGRYSVVIVLVRRSSPPPGVPGFRRVRVAACSWHAQQADRVHQRRRVVVQNSSAVIAAADAAINQIVIIVVRGVRTMPITSVPVIN